MKILLNNQLQKFYNENCTFTVAKMINKINCGQQFVKKSYGVGEFDLILLCTNFTFVMQNLYNSLKSLQYFNRKTFKTT